MFGPKPHRLVATSALALVVVATPIATMQARKISDNRSVLATAPICRVETDAKVMALTFDDGPDANLTPSVLDFLRSNEVKATFFLEGSKAAANPELVRRIRDEGHEVANHTWDHRHLSRLDARSATEQAQRANDVLRATSKPMLFRAPLGEIDKEQIEAVKSLQLTPLHWSLAVDHLVGGQGLSPEATAARLVSRIEAGEIVLAHDVPGHRRTEAFEALRRAVPELKATGFAFVDATTLLGSGKPVRSRPRFGYWQHGYTCPKP